MAKSQMLQGRLARAKDVAELAQVSVSSVSLVANGKADGRLSAEVKSRIENAIAELDYQPALRAQQLARGENSTIAIAVPDIANPFFGRMLSGLAEELGDSYELNVSIRRNGSEYTMEDVRHALRREPGALILVAPSRSLVSELPNDDRLILVDAPGAERVVRLNWDLEEGCRLLAEHLITQGHHRAGYLGLSHGHRTLTLDHRRQRLQALLRDQGATIAADFSLAEPSATAAADLIRDEISKLREMEITALIVEDDYYALGVFATFNDLGISVPDDFCVAAFNDSEISRLTIPRLVSVKMDAREMGRLAATHARLISQGLTTTEVEVNLPCNRIEAYRRRVV